jgi:hypothetical protein
MMALAMKKPILFMVVSSFNVRPDHVYGYSRVIALPPVLPAVQLQGW